VHGPSASVSYTCSEEEGYHLDLPCVKSRHIIYNQKVYFTSFAVSSLAQFRLELQHFFIRHAMTNEVISSEFKLLLELQHFLIRHDMTNDVISSEFELFLQRNYKGIKGYNLAFSLTSMGSAKSLNFTEITRVWTEN
jgi:hypothetical protein